MAWRTLKSGEWRSAWADELERCAVLAADYNWKSTRDGGVTPGVLWPVVRQFAKGKMQLRPVMSSGADVVTVESYSFGIPPCVQEATGLPIFPALSVDDRLRKKLKAATRELLLRVPGGLSAADLPMLVGEVPSSELALIVRHATLARPCWAADLPGRRA